MATKLYDLVVKTGEYTSNGETKGRYENVGSMMQGDKGQFLILKRTFNPAGVANPDNKDSIIVSCFEPKDQGQQQGQVVTWNQDIHVIARLDRVLSTGNPHHTITVDAHDQKRVHF